jgi:penicillin-insensitive murein endopeptidase
VRWYARIAVAAACGCLLSFFLPGPVAGARRELPPKYKKSPYALMSLSVGHPNDGWQVRAKRLGRRGYLHIKKGSSKVNYGHPALVKMLERTARDIARSAPGSVMLVGDLSRKEGGPLAGHHSHQSGRDADIAFYAKNSKGRRVVLKDFVAFGADGEARDGSGLVFDDNRNWLLVQSWIRDHRAGLSHIFVSRPLRHRLIEYARSHKSFRRYVDEANRLLKEPRDAEPHNDHFHVRISCPKRQQDICHEQPK